jgi:hypothetical protein
VIVESSNHIKNGANPKSQMSRINFLKNKIMFKKVTLHVTLILGLIFSFEQYSLGQLKTKDELRAERQEFVSEMKSKDYEKRQKSLEKLTDSEPNKTGISNVDMLQESSKGFLTIVKANNDFLSKFKRDLIDKGSGEIDITLHKAEKGDYLKLAEEIAKTAPMVAIEAQKVQNIKDDVKSLPPTQALPATRSVKYSSEALQLSADELSLQLKLVNNIIATINSADNY